MTMFRIYKRLINTAVFWSWIFSFTRLASGLLLLPLVLHKLSTADLGMYYVLLSLAAMSQLVDFGFGSAIGRFITYAMAGAGRFRRRACPNRDTVKRQITLCFGNCWPPPGLFSGVSPWRF
jgi:hypothetical protein